MVVGYDEGEILPEPLSGCEMNRVKAAEPACIERPRRIKQRVVESHQLYPRQDLASDVRGGCILICDRARHLCAGESARDP